MSPPADTSSAAAAADAHIASARKRLKSSKIPFFSSPPDYEGAAQDFEEAARCLRAAGSKSGSDAARAIECLVWASENWAQSGSHFQAAKAACAAAAAASANASQAADLYERAANHYVLAQNEESAAESLAKAALAVQATDANRAAALHARGIDYYFEEEKYRTAVQPIKDAISFAVERRRSADVMTFTERLKQAYEMPAARRNAHGISHASLALIVYHLYEEDRVMATREMEKMLLEKDALRAATEILEAQDEATFRRALASQTVSFLDPCFGRLLRDIPFIAPPAAPAAAPKSASRNEEAAAQSPIVIPGFQQPQQSAAVGAAAGDSTDEDLC